MTRDNHGFKQYTREEIIQLAQNWFNEHEKLVQRDLKHENNMPSSCQVTKHFGTLQNLLNEAGIKSTTSEKLFKRKCLSDEEMLENYKKFVEEHLKTHMYLPTNDDLDKCPTIQSTSVYINRFGSFDNVNRLIGYGGYNVKVLEEDMLNKYKQACVDQGHVLSSREITALSQSTNNYIYCTESYLAHFGTLHNLQEICGLDKTKPGAGATKEELIEKLKWLGSYIGRTPVMYDLSLYKNMPSANVYTNTFGSFKEALKEAGYQTKRNYKTKNGVRLFSTYELKLARVLESYKIPYETEIYYKDVISNFKRRYRFDFRINLNGLFYYIEMFGIVGNKVYDNRKEEKIQLCKTHHIPLIQFEQEDIYSKTNQQIYEKLISDIKKFKEVT